jgi:hypothetical protein
MMLCRYYKGDFRTCVKCNDIVPDTYSWEAHWLGPSTTEYTVFDFIIKDGCGGQFDGGGYVPYGCVPYWGAKCGFQSVYVACDGDSSTCPADSTGGSTTSGITRRDLTIPRLRKGGP